jgi:hypothetical protein
MSNQREEDQKALRKEQKANKVGALLALTEQRLSVSSCSCRHRLAAAAAAAAAATRTCCRWPASAVMKSCCTWRQRQR